MFISKVKRISSLSASGMMFATMLALYIAAGGCSVNPLTGEQRLMFIPEQSDVPIGRQYAPEIEKELKGRIESVTLQDYLNQIGQKIAAVSHRPGYDFKYIACNDESVNALALPGGHIYITRGMLEQLTTESQLAAILAHETAHVTARHNAAAMSRQLGMNMVLFGAAYGDVPGEVLQAASVTGQLMQLGYSRKQEREADLYGLDYLVGAGYSPYGMIETMQILQQQSQTRPVEFFSTHPWPENREQYLTDKIDVRYYNLTGLKIGKDQYQQNAIANLPPKEQSAEDRTQAVGKP